MPQATLNKNWSQGIQGIGVDFALMPAPTSATQTEISLPYSILHLVQDSIITNPSSSKSLYLIGENKSWEESRSRHIKSLRGKYKNKLISSVEFAKNKIHEITLEG